MPHAFDPDGKRLPIKLDSTSNGEFVPVPLDPVNRGANRLAQEWAGENARRLGLGRRAFMISACGAAVGECRGHPRPAPVCPRRGTWGPP